MGSYVSGGARGQTAELIKTFGERCPEAYVNDNPRVANYAVVFDHEGGKITLKTIRLRFSTAPVMRSLVTRHARLAIQSKGLARPFSAIGKRMRN